MTDLLVSATRLLAGLDADHAAVQNGIGYNRIDGPMGHQLAETPGERWTAAQRFFMHRRLAKYRKQLAAYGIDYDAIPKPEPVEAPAARPSQRETDEPVARRTRKPAGSFKPAYWPFTFPWLPGVEFQSVANTDIDPTAGYDYRQHRVIYNDNTAKMNLGPIEADQEAKRLNESVWLWLAMGEDAATAPKVRPVEPPKARIAGGDIPAMNLSWGFEHPQFEAIKVAVKGLNARWRREAKVWEVPVTVANIDAVMAVLAEFGFDLPEDADGVLAAWAERWGEAVEGSRAKDAAIVVPGIAAGLELYGFQKAGVAYAIQHKRTLIADEMGLGKTPQAICTTQVADAYPALVIVPASLKLNWRREWRRWIPGKRIAVLNGKPVSLIGMDGKPAFDVVIINYDILGKWIDELRAFPFRTLIVDECHYIKNGKAQRSQHVADLAKQGAEIVLALTGTPLLNRPKELWTLIQLLRVDAVFGGFWGFHKRYCNASESSFGWSMDGAANLEELNLKLRSTCMVRRRKEEVLTDLPDLLPYADLPTALAPKAAREYADAEADLRSYVAKIKAEDAERIAGWKAAAERMIDADADDRARKVAAAIAEMRAAYVESGAALSAQAEALTRINYLRQIAARGKLDAACEHIDALLEAGEQVIVFGWHQEIVKAIAAKYHARTIMGGDNIKNIEEAKERFQSGEDRVIVCNLKAGGVGHTLTAAANVVFVEFGWNPSDMEQAAARAHRIGQTRPVTPWRIIAEGTIDEDILALIDAKAAVVNAAHDGAGAIEQRKVIETIMAAIDRRVDAAARVAA